MALKKSRSAPSTGGRPGYSSASQIHRTASSSSSGRSSLPFAISKFSGFEVLSFSSSWLRFRLRPRRVSSRSSNGSEDKEALGVDLLEEGLATDLVFRSTRPDVLEDTDDCWDCELVARALDDRRGEGGAIEGAGSPI